jgi:hypothetical protein
MLQILRLFLLKAELFWAPQSFLAEKAWTQGTTDVVLRL